MSLAARCRQLALKYKLSPEETLSIMATALSVSLTQALKCRVITCRDGEHLHIYREGRNGDGLWEIKFQRLRRDVKRRFRKRFERELAREKARGEHEYLATLRGTVLRGTVDRILDDGALLVLFLIEELLSCRELFALCPLRDQIPRERGLLRIGDALSFFVSSVRLVNVQGLFRHEIRVSRTSPRLPEILLGKLSSQKGIRCVGRIAGKHTRIVSPSKIPREAVKVVSNELGERIVVRWRSSKKQRTRKVKSSRTPTWG